jgi:hypothetical protein
MARQITPARHAHSSARRFNEIYETAREMVGSYLPFYSLEQRVECSKLLVAELKRLGLVNEITGRLDPDLFTRFISHSGAIRKRGTVKSHPPERFSSPKVTDFTDPLNEVEADEPASE